MNTTRKNARICYTGVGSRRNATHTVQQFKRVTRKVYPKSKCKEMNNWKKLNPDTKEICPKRTNVSSWVDFLGALYTTPKRCKSMTNH